MPKTHLTDITVRHLEPPQNGQVMFWDDALPGFGVRVSQGGVKTFCLVHGRERTRTQLGRYPTITLAAARTRAKELLAEHTLGKTRAPRVHFEDALELFFATHVAQKCQPSTQKEMKRILNKHLRPSLRHKNLDECATHHITNILDKMTATPSEADHVFRRTKTFFRWCVKRRMLPHSPLEGLDPPAKLVSRERVLSDGEITRVLAVCAGAGAYGTLVQLLLLTGQRKGEITGLRAEMINASERTITLPVTKNGRAHTFPYGDTVAGILETLPSEGLLFPGRDKDSPFNGFSKATDTFRKACGIDHWTLHDLRRTFGTGLARLGIFPVTVEALLNHVTGTLSPIARVYNRHSYLPEARVAIGVWEKHIASLQNPG